MPCCTPKSSLVKRAAPLPTSVTARPAASSAPAASTDGPIVLYPGENPADLRGAPFTTLPASVLATLAPAVTSRPASQVVPPTALPTSFASIGTSRTPLPTASTSPHPSPSPTQSPDSNAQPQSSSTTTVAVVVSIIAAIVVGVIAYAVYRYHLRKKLGTKADPLKLRPLITARSISRPILSPTKPVLPLSHPSFRRSRESLGIRLKAPPPPLSPVQEKTRPATSTREPKSDPRKTRDFYTFETTDILESYGSETSYPSTHAAEVDFEYPIFRPSPAQLPRIHNVQDAYPTTPTEAEDIKPRASPASSSPNPSARRLQNLPFKIPKPSPSHSTKPLRRS